MTTLLSKIWRKKKAGLGACARAEFPMCYNLNQGLIPAGGHLFKKSLQYIS